MNFWERERRLSALVAENVMGWEVRWTERTRQKRPLGWSRCWVKRNGSRWSKCPNFTSMSAAPLVWRRMSELGWSFRLCVDPDGSSEAQFDHPNGDRGWFGLAKPDDEALVMLLAACDALGVEVPEELKP